MSEGGDKTEEPTDKKIEDARKKGNIWTSKDLSGVVGFAVAMGVIKVLWETFEARVKHLFFFAFDHLAHPQDIVQATGESMVLALTTLMVLCIPIAFAAALSSGLVDFLLIGPLFSVESVMPKLEKLDPVAGLKNLFSKKQMVEMAKSIVKLFISGYVVYVVVHDSMGLVAATIRGNVELTMLVMGELVYRVVSRVVMLLVAFAIVDVWWQRKAYMKDMMMSKDEVRREYKESEGDPHQKWKRKEMHQEIMESAQMESVKSADVVVTNPEHVAVALQYSRDRDAAPRVIAKGLDGQAAAIRELAKAHDVPMMRNVPLAHALFRIDVNSEIPAELYDAVAEVLTFVYQLKRAVDLNAYESSESSGRSGSGTESS